MTSPPLLCRVHPVGAIYLGAVMTNIVFDNLDVEFNTAAFQGGGIFMHSLVNGLVLSSSRIHYNEGKFLGGGRFLPPVLFRRCGCVLLINPASAVLYTSPYCRCVR
jgi:hypothetical protein